MAAFLLVLLGVTAGTAQSPETSASTYEAAAKSREEAAIIWENLGDRVRAAETWGEAAAAWEKAASSWEKAGAKSRAGEAWNRFRVAVEKRDQAEVVLERVSRSNPKIAAGSAGEALAVRVTDRKGNPVAGVSVAFDIVSRPDGGDASIDKARATTDAAGKASAGFTPGSRAGAYSVSATLPQFSTEPASFQIEVAPGAAAKLAIAAGNNQVIKVNQRATSPLIVTVTDVFGNPIPGVTVDYRIVSAPKGATGQTLSADEAATDAAGRAGVRFQAGHLGGNYIVLVESGDLEGSPSRFEMIVKQTVPTIRIIGLEYHGVSDSAPVIAGTGIKIDATYLLPELGRAFRSEIERLYALGRFSDIVGSIESIDDERGVAVFTLVERPAIGEIRIEGEKETKEEDLRSKLGIAEGSPYSRHTVERARSAMLEHLKGEGYLNATIRVETGLIDGKGKDPRVSIAFHLAESEKVKIKRLNFRGNKFFSDASLNWHMKTGKGKVYKQSEFQEDRQKILSRYYEKGFISAEMREPEIRFDEKGDMIVDVVFEEGPQYRIGEIKFTGNTALDENELRALLKQQSGDVFRASKFFSSIEDMRLATARKGFAEARVVPQENLRYADGIVDFVINVREGQILFLDKISLEGNFKTQAKVILREVHIAEGDVLDGDQLEKSRKRLEKLGFFEPGSVRMILQPGTAPDRRELVVKVVEGRTGQVQFGGAFSGTDGFVGFTSLQKKNFDPFDFFSFTGAGQDISVSAEYGGQKNSFNFSWTEPYFRNKPVSIGLDGYNIFQEREGFDWRRRGGAGRLSHKWGEYGRMSYKYEYEEVDVFHVTNLAPTEVQMEAGFPSKTRYLRSTSSITTGFTHDTRDDLNFPMSGHKLELENELAVTALGGNVAFTKPGFTFSNYYPVFNKKHVLAFRGQYGTISNFFDNTNEIPAVEKFYLGGSNTVRGYAERSIQIFSRDRTSVEGPGSSFALANLEYRVPFTEDKSITGALFADAGGVFAGDFDFIPGEIVFGTGAGVRMVTPLGLIRLDYGWGLNYPSRGRGIFHFSIGQTF